MDKATFTLAVAPPLLAIFVEAISPLENLKLDAQADIDLPNGIKSGPDYQETIYRINTMLGSSAELSGLAPTLVAAVASGFAVLHELPNPFWFVFAYILVFVAIAVFIIWLLAGSSLFRIGATKIRVSFEGGLKVMDVGPTQGRFTRKDIVRRTIYSSNMLLLISAALVFALA